MKKIDSIVEEKIYQVQSYKENLTGEVEKIKSKKITFNFWYTEFFFLFSLHDQETKILQKMSKNYM